MTSEDSDRRDLFLRARAVFDELCELPAEERTAHAVSLARGDEALLDQVRELLEADEAAGDLLGSSALEAVGLGGGTDPASLRIPGFELEEVIGSGGMGIVYRARQENPERSVAVKLLRPGWMTKSSLRRFEDEARVLGWLSHPGIATVFDAGRVETAAGPQPYLVMELVSGERVDAYADRHRLDKEDRLRLIRDVCRAVHHAHQKGVVHRDLKPANILVDEDAQVRVLDFGVARILDPECAPRVTRARGRCSAPCPT